MEAKRVMGENGVAKVLLGGIAGKTWGWGPEQCWSGCDPEVFVLGGNGALMPAWEFLPEKSTHAPVFWDGFQAECRPDAGVCLSYLVARVRTHLKKMLTEARKRDAHAKFTLESAVEVPEAVRASIPQSYVQLGCDASFNIYGAPGGFLENPRKLKYRFAGGHIHFGLGGQPPDSEVADIVRALDLLLAVPAVGMFEGIDGPIRRRYYGRAGEFRLPQHGLEYRVLANSWLVHPAIMHMVFMLARVVMKGGRMGIRGAVEVADEEVRDIVDNCNAAAARALVDRNKNFFKSLIMWGCENGSEKYVDTIPTMKDYTPQAAAATWAAIHEGVGAVLPGGMDVEKNWELARDENVVPVGLKGHCAAIGWDR